MLTLKYIEAILLNPEQMHNKCWKITWCEFKQSLESRLTISRKKNSLDFSKRGHMAENMVRHIDIHKQNTINLNLDQRWERNDKIKWIESIIFIRIQNFTEIEWIIAAMLVCGCYQNEIRLNWFKPIEVKTVEMNWNTLNICVKCVSTLIWL